MPTDRLCRACFDGVYPVPLPEPEHLGKHLLELEPTLPLDLDDAPGLSLSPGAGRATRSAARDAAASPERTPMTDPQPTPTPAGRPGATTYEAAGVSIDAGDKAVELMKVWVDKARRPEMVGGIGGFAGLFDATALKAYDHPLLATSADGVGTKVAIAQAMDVHHTIGFDLVGMLVDDLVVCGAEPLFLTDYIATGRVVPERIAAIVQGIAEACVQAGCALIGGETAEHPGLLGPDEYDVAGSTTGVVEAAAPARPGPGPRRGRGRRDGLLRPALQRLLAGAPRAARARPAGQLDRTSTSSAARWARSCSSRPGSTPRPAWTSPAAPAPMRCRTSPAAGWRPTWPGSCPRTWSPTSTAGTWTPQPVFDLVRRVGSVAQPDLERTLNCGVGMVALTDPDGRRRGGRACSPGTASTPGCAARSREPAGAVGAPRRVGDACTGSTPGW